MKKTMIMMFFVTLFASSDAQAQTPSGKIGCNMQDAKNPAAKIPTVTENLDWILHGTPIDGIAYYNNRLMPGAAEYSANASVARTVSMQAFCNELTVINFATKGELHAVDGKAVVITPERVLKNESWLKDHIKPMKFDFGTKPVVMVAANLNTRSLDTVVHANGLGVQDIAVLELPQGLFPVFLDLCGNEGFDDFVFAIVSGSAKKVEAPAPPNPNLQASPAPIDPSLQKMIDKNNQATIDAVTAATKGNASGNAPIVVIVNPVMYTGGNTLTTGGGQNGSNGKDGKDGTSSSSPSSIITTTTTPPANVDPFAPGTPGRSLVVSNNNAPQGWVNAQNPVMAQQTACPTCTGVSQGSWNRSDVALIEQQGQTNIAQNDQMINQNGQMIKLQKTSNGIAAWNATVNTVNTTANVANTIRHWNDQGGTVNIFQQIMSGLGGGSSDFPNGINGTVSNNSGSAADFRNGF